MTSDDEFPEIDPPRNNKQLDELRSASLRWLDEDDTFTCDNCGYAPKCPLAYDPYNTNGDCLMDK